MQYSVVKPYDILKFLPIYSYISLIIIIIKNNMRKTTLFLLAFIAGITLNAQESISSAGFEITSDINASSTTQAAQVACTTEIVSTSIDMGFGNLNATEVADNFVIPDGERFEVSTITVFVIANNGGAADIFSDVTIRFYDSAGEFPGALITEEVIVPGGFTNLGAVNGDLDAYQLDLTLTTPVELLGVDGSETTYWFSVFGPNFTSASNFLETTDETADTVVTSFKDGADPAAAWSNINNGAFLPPGVAYSLGGDCNTLSTDDNVFADNISLFPNPTNGDLNINFTRSFGAATVTVININGQVVLTSSIEGIGNNTIATSKLANGVYFAQITAENSNATVKFIKS